MLCLQLNCLESSGTKPVTVNMELVTHWLRVIDDTKPYTELVFQGDTSILVTETKEEIDSAVQCLLSGTYIVN